MWHYFFHMFVKRKIYEERPAYKYKIHEEKYEGKYMKKNLYIHKLYEENYEGKYMKKNL